MKVRTGFVSNSSSSSFIVAFDRDPRNDPAYLKEAVFGGQEFVPAMYPGYGTPNEWPVDDLVGHLLWVFDDKEPLGPAGVMEALADMKSHDRRLPDPDDFLDPETGEADRAAYEAARHKALREAVAPGFLDEVAGGKVVLAFDISDETDIGAQMEHGGTFDGLPGFRVSNH